MVKIYTSPGSVSSRKAKSWFKTHDIPFEEKNIFKTTLDESEVKEMLVKSENGTDDLISRRSKIMRSINIDLDDMSLSELIRFIQANPSILRRPIMVDDRHIQAGYNSEEIETFIPRQRMI